MELFIKNKILILIYRNEEGTFKHRFWEFKLLVKKK
jgi:hypothetical protein